MLCYGGRGGGLASIDDSDEVVKNQNYDENWGKYDDVILELIGEWIYIRSPIYIKLKALSNQILNLSTGTGSR